MIQFLKNLIGGNKEAVEERQSPLMVAGRPRSSKWPKVRDAFLKDKICAACGREDKLNAHHIKPYHLYPELELEPTNLVALCEGVTACHYLCGHGGTSWSVNVPDPERAAKRYAEFLNWIRLVAK